VRWKCSADLQVRWKCSADLQVRCTCRPKGLLYERLCRPKGLHYEGLRNALEGTSRRDGEQGLQLHLRLRACIRSRAQQIRATDEIGEPHQAEAREDLTDFRRDEAQILDQHLRSAVE